MTDERHEVEDRRQESSFKKNFSSILTGAFVIALTATAGILYSFGNTVNGVVITQAYIIKQVDTVIAQLILDRADRVTRIEYNDLRERIRAIERKEFIEGRK